MSDSELQQAIRDHYERQRLPAEKIDTLLGKAAAPGADVTHSTSSGTRRWIWFGGAAVAALVLVAIGWGSGWLQSHEIEKASVQSMARKIALGHTKDLGVEFSESKFDALRSSMPKLDFSLTRPQDKQAGSYTLVGSRYCSLNQRIAALLKLVDSEGRRHTLYQVACDSSYDTAHGKAVTLDGLRIRFWREGGLFMGMASPTR